MEHNGISFVTVGKGILHCQTCLQITHNYIEHATDHVVPAPPVVDIEGLLDFVHQHEPVLDQTAVYKGGCWCGWRGPEDAFEAHRIAAVAAHLRGATRG